MDQAPLRLPSRLFVLGSESDPGERLGRALAELLVCPLIVGGCLRDFSAELGVLLGRFQELPARQFDSMLAAKTDPEVLEKHFVNMVRRIYLERSKEGTFVELLPGLAGMQAVPFARAVFPDAAFVFSHEDCAPGEGSDAAPGDDDTVERTELLSAWRALRATLPVRRATEADEAALHAGSLGKLAAALRCTPAGGDPIQR
jgi:hypothetical protein